MVEFVTGCTHFGHSGIIKHTGRPFENVREMDRELIRLWNETVRPKDTVYHLGDFAWNGKASEYIKLLNGEIILLQGNHDPEGWGKDYMEIKFASRKWVLMHYPIEEWNGYFRGAAHLHCHTHKKELISAKNRFNVGIDATDLKPIALNVLEEMLK